MSFIKLLIHKLAFPALVAWTLLIFYFTLIPARYLVDAPWYNYDKVGHLGIFFGWTLLVLAWQKSSDLRFSMLQVLLISLAFGLAIEVLQYLLPLNRSAETADFVADSLGSILSIPVFRLLERGGFV